MASYLLRIPDDLHDRLRILAKRRRQSINSVLLCLIEKAVKEEQSLKGEQR